MDLEISTALGSSGSAMAQNKKHTIIEAIKIVLLKESPLSHEEIYKRIKRENLYDFGARDPKAIVGGMIRRHCYGKSFPSASPTKHFVISMTKGSKALYSIWDGAQHKPLTDDSPKSLDRLPEELMVDNHEEHLEQIKSELLAALVEASPGFFEKLVLRVLLKMGFGWDQDLSGEITGGPYDDGIDGIINGDKLGLEKVYMQAKRYALHREVKANEVREFIGAMTLKGARKGVFITSTQVSNQAMGYVKELKDMTISIIDGQHLASLLLEYHLGVKPVGNFTTFTVDKEEFFE